MIEAEQTVPFQVRRVYYIFGTEEGVERGFHVHKKHSIKWLWL